MSVAFGAASRGRLSARAFILVSTSLGSSLLLASAAGAQNVSYTGNSGYALTQTDPISGGPRAVDITTSGGNIALNLATVNTTNNGNMLGAGIAGNNTGAGDVAIAATTVAASGTGQTYGIDARTASGNITIDSGTVTANATPNSRGIYAITGSGNITINAGSTDGGQRGIYTGFNGTDGPNVTTITSQNVTANGTGSTNAILAQGNTVAITSGTASNTNAAGYQGATILANAGTGGATIVAGTTNALGQNQAAIQVFSDGAVGITSTAVNTTQNSDGITVESGTTIAINSAAVTTLGNGARGIVLGGADGGGVLNGGVDGIPYVSADVTSGTIATSGINAFGIYATPTSGATTITSDTITTTGDGATGIYATAIGAGVFSGATTINSTGTLSTSGASAAGIEVANASGPVAITASDIRTTGTGASAIVVAPTSGSVAPITVDAGTVRVGGANTTAINLSSAGIAGTLTVSVADSISSGAAVDARSAGAVSVTGGTVQVTGAGAFGLNAISSGSSATVASTTLSVNDGRGIFAQGATDTKVTSGTLTTTGSDYDYALIAQNVPASGVTPGTVTVDSTALTSGAGGILAYSPAGAIAVTSGTASSAGTDTATIVANATTGAVTINADTTSASGVGSHGISASSTTGDIAITANSVSTTGAYDPDSGYSSDALIAFNSTSGTGKITINAGTTSAVGDFASAIFAQGGGAVAITSGTASASGAQTDVIGGVSGRSDVSITAGSTSATGAGSVAIGGRADNGNVTINAGTAFATAGNAISVTAGGNASVTATSAIGGGDGGAGVTVVGGTGVVLNIGTASSNGTAVTTTNSRTGVVTTTRADAIVATATTGAILANIGSATATGAGADAVHLVANGAGGAVTANITGTLSSASGTALFIDPPGAVVVNVAAGASLSGATAGVDATGGSNTITNAGSITSTTGAGIRASGQTMLVDSGSISGANGVAVQLGATDDTVILQTGAAFGGRILGGGGSDAAILSGTSTTASGTQTIAGFAGFDSLTVQSGYWTAQAANASSFNSATIDSGASLEVANGASGIAGVSAPTIVDNGNLVVASSAASGGSTFGSTVVSGSGNVLFTGAGTATLDGNNSIATTGTITVDGGSTLQVTGTQGGTVVAGSGGTLVVGNGGTTGALTGNVVDNGTLVVNRSDNVIFAGALSGTGNFVKQGAGELIFGSNYSFTGTTTIAEGAIKLSTPIASTSEIDLEGAGQLDLSGAPQQIAQLSGTSTAASINIAGGALTVDQSATTSFAGSLTGDGSLTKTGSGSLNLTGVSTYAGPTTIDGGRLAVNGSIVSPVLVNAAGVLGGTGSVGTVTIASGGTYAPGNSIGTQTVNGNVTFSAGAIYEVQANAAGQADRINATGTATLNGGTVEVLAASGSYAKLTDYTILTAAKGITGTFANVTSDMAFLSPLLTYGTNSVSLTLARNDIAFASLAANPRELAVANAIAARGAGDAIYKAVLFDGTAGARTTFNQLAGELHASLPSELTDAGRRVRGAVLDHLTPEQGLGVWGQGLQSYASSQSQAGLDKIQSNRTGAVGGVDYAHDGIVLGLLTGYLNDQVRMPAAGSSARINMTFAGASASYSRDALSVRIGGTYAWQHIDTTRQITAPGLAETLSAAPHANSAQVFGEVGYALTKGVVKLTPFVGDAFNWTRINGFSERGGVAALTVQRDSRTTDFVSAGLHMTGTAPISAKIALLPKITVSYEHGFGDLNGASVAQIGGTGPAFADTGARLGRDTLNVDTGFDLLFGSKLSLGANGFASTSSQWSDYGVKASVSLRF